jgi:hypothetical protein
MPAAGWVNLGFVLYFQPARILGYAAAFALGHLARRCRYFEGAAPGLTTLWVIAAGVGGYGVVSLAWSWGAVLSPLARLVADAVTYNLFAFSMTMFLTSAAFAAKSRGLTAARLAGSAYGLYWLHEIILMPCIYALIPLRAPIFLKWAAAVLVTVTLGLLIDRFVLKRAPPSR